MGWKGHLLPLRQRAKGSSKRLQNRYVRYSEGFDNGLIKSVEIIGGNAKVEVSGSISLDKIDTLSKLDINFISIGSLTHSPKASDISMNFILP